jgi:hypothetical protein
MLWGLTLVLVAALIGLILRGRRMELEQAAQRFEVVQPSKPTNTRVLNPQDLEIVNPAVEQKSGSGAPGEIEIRNNGSVAYSQILLRIIHLDRKGKEVGSKTYSVGQTLMPQASIKVTNLPAEAGTASTGKLEITVVSADVGSTH